MSLDDGFHRIGSDPYAVLSDAKDGARRLRGQLPAPVTVWTAYGPGGTQTGITVSSVLVAEGDAPTILGLIAPLSEFWDAVQVSKRFVVHVLGAEQTRAADQFALRYPVSPFDGLRVSASEYGPILEDVGTRAEATLTSYVDVGYSLLVRATLGEFEFADEPPAPLIHYRGRYFTAASRNRQLP